MPIVKHENYTMRDAARETRIYDKTFAKYFDGNTDTELYDLRTLNTFCDQSKLDTTIAGFPPFPVPVEGQLTPSYEPSLRSYRGYNKINGMYVYNWSEMFITMTDIENKRVWAGGSEVLVSNERVYVTLPGFEGWHIPTGEEIDATVNYYGGANRAATYLKNHNWKTPSALIGLSLSPSGLLNGNGDQIGLIGEKSFYPYISRDNYDGFNSIFDGDQLDYLTGFDTVYYRDENNNRKKISGDYVKTESVRVFTMEHNSAIVTKSTMRKKPSTVRLVRNKSNSATSFTDLEGNVYGIYTIGDVVWMDRDVCCTYEASYNNCLDKPSDRTTFRTLNNLSYADVTTPDNHLEWPWGDNTEYIYVYGHQKFGMSGGRLPELNKHNYFPYPSFSKNMLDDNRIIQNDIEWREILTPGYRILPYYTS